MCSVESQTVGKLPCGTDVLRYNFVTVCTQMIWTCMVCFRLVLKSRGNSFKAIAKDTPNARVVLASPPFSVSGKQFKTTAGRYVMISFSRVAFRCHTFAEFKHTLQV